ncbi:hypothetical protein FSW04_22550 [Baekduia soli]|uniref:Glycosyltransferase RgtA/B/C/D-like domain-containing protein n=1 Tax=Baekduia soli TaxID=496014 RepID=A0A5B8UA87_9ACTN|nr:hypothetical protein [Baekduia soli]QEC50076.1 hypothetical protein FSW04_22550 [Baekduia soli]
MTGARPWRGPLLLIGICVALAALSLLLPSAPTYDPWSWIIWGREITHLDLVTSQGPSWKPLPVAFTTVFSLFGSAAPDLWLVVARAGALASVVLAFRVARTIGGGVVGGAAAAAAVALAPWFIRNAALGNSEGLSVAFLLAAIDREMAGRRGTAFAMAVCAGLLRPEAWPFLGLYGLFLLWRRAIPARVILGAGAAVVALWLLPEWWGSGDLLRAMHRAKNVNAGAPTYDDKPALALLRNAQGMLTAPLLAGLGCAAAMLVARRDRVIALLVALGLAWLGLVAYMTQDGFSGNQRYLIAPVVLFMVLSGAGAGWLMGRVLELVRHGASRPGAMRRTLVAAAAIGAAVLFAAPSLGRFGPNMRDVHYQADLADELPGVVAAAGGPAALRRCGDAYTGPFLVPVVAWNLHRHIEDVQIDPQPPALVFRVRTTEGSRAVPSLAAVGDTRTLATGVRWRIVAACGAAGA